MQNYKFLNHIVLCNVFFAIAGKSDDDERRLVERLALH